MGLVRILVDGFSLLHAWPDLARGKARHSAAARDELVFVLTQYSDACGTPISVIFDGAGAPPGVPKTESDRQVEVLFSRAGQTADDIIERVTHRMRPFGEVLVVTDDFAERDTVISLGGLASSCDNFIRTIEAEFGEMNRALQFHNLRERTRFRRPK
jgi:predicted RNA-binding protein with PIN domain